MEIKLDRSIRKVKVFVFSLCGCSIKNLTYLFFGLVMGEQLISASIEQLIYGETFGHWFDSVFLFSISVTYFYFAYELGDFLLDVMLNAELIKESK